MVCGFQPAQNILALRWLNITNSDASGFASSSQVRLESQDLYLSVFTQINSIPFVIDSVLKENLKSMYYK